METATMGKVIVKAKVQNLDDLYEVKKGQRAVADVRTVEMDNALVDTGATMLLLPSRYIAALGLELVRTREALTAAGMIPLKIYEVVRLTVDGREASVEVAEVPDNNPPLIGQIPLEILDFLVDPQGQRLVGNPAHGGQQMIEVWSV